MPRANFAKKAGYDTDRVRSGNVTRGPILIATTTGRVSMVAMTIYLIYRTIRPARWNFFHQRSPWGWWTLETKSLRQGAILRVQPK